MFIYACFYVILFLSGVLLTFIDILAHPVNDTLQRGNHTSSRKVSGCKSPTECKIRFHNIIAPVVGCICMSRLGSVNRTIGFSPQCRRKAALETQMDVWFFKVLLQWQLHITHALILILKYMLYIIAVFIRILGDYLTDWVSLSMVLVYKTVFLKPIVRKVGIITWTLVQCCPRWGTALILSLLPFLWIQMCVPITPFQYQPESWQVFTTSAFRKPVFVYRSEKCLYSRLRLVCWI